MNQDRNERAALHRYGVIAEALAPRLTPAERGRVVRALASRAHPHPDGGERRYSRGTIDRWIRAYRARGLAGLRPAPRSDQGAVRRHPELLAEAAALRAELPSRSAAHISDILRRRHGVRISERTIREHLRRRGLHRAALAASPRAFGRYEADRPNEVWIADVLVGPFVPHPRVGGSRRARCFLIVDDHSRLLVHGRWVPFENTRAGQEVLREAVVRRGVPEILYTDRGSPYVAEPLARTCAVLGIRLVHSRPSSPQGRGKQERLNRFIRERFLAEAEAAGIPSFEELNELFMAWAEQVANARIHAETGQPPIERFLAAGPPRAADPARLAEAFRWAVMRVVTRTATVSLQGNRYQVDPALVGKRVELRFSPEDLTHIDVYLEGRAAGEAVPFVIGRHVHPQVPQAETEPPAPTGVDYLGMVLASHEEAAAGGIAYRDAAGEDEEDEDDEEEER